jgi:hypothetical protein
MKIFQRVLHVVVVVSLMVGLYAIIHITSLLVFLRYFYQAMQAGPDKIQDYLVWAKYFSWGYWMIAALLLGLGVYAVAKKLCWKILLPGLLLVSSGLFYLRWEGEPPQQADLGLRVTEADERYRIVMWMAKDSPYSRVSELCISSTAATYLRLPAETKDWSAYIEKYRDEILQAWEKDLLGREWVDAINAHPPAGVWPLRTFSDPLLQFLPIRASSSVRTARAYALALDGHRDEAFSLLVPLISVWQHLQRTGPGLVNGMIANVVLKNCYITSEEILKLGDISNETKTVLAETLNSAPTMRQVVRNGILGEYESMAGAVDAAQTMYSQQNLTQNQKLSLVSWYMPHLVSSPNLTKREIMHSLQRPCELAVARQLERLKAFEKAKPSWSLKNPAGMALLNMGTPSLAKVVEHWWQVEDLRLELLKQLEKP